MTHTPLKPCPFCGAAPKMEPWHGGAPTKVMISCSKREYGDEDGGCSVGPSVTGETPEEAARHWNRREPAYPDGTLFRVVGGKVERVEVDVVGALERVILAHDGRSWSARTLAKIVAALKAPPGAS